MVLRACHFAGEYGKMKKNILLMVPLLYQGGQERICVMTARLLEKKYNVHLLIFDDRDAIYDVTGLHLINLNIPSKKGILHKVLNVLKRVRKVKQYVKQLDIDIIYSFGSSANLVNVLAGKRAQKWIGIRGYDAAFDGSFNMRLTTKLADKVVCCSKVIADDVEKVYGAKNTAVVYNPCEVDKLLKLAEEPITKYREFFDTDDKIIISVGNIEQRKCFWHLIKGFALLHKKMPDTRLVIVGASDSSKYEKLAEDLQISDRVLFTGVDRNPFKYLKHSDLYVLNSYKEGFPNALIEAMAMSLPVMAVNCKSGPAEILTENYREVEDQSRVYYGEYGILLPLMNPQYNFDAQTIDPEEEIMAEEMRKLLMDEAGLDKLAQKASFRVREFTLEAYSAKLEELIEGCTE